METIAQNHQLHCVLRERIEISGGWIPFDQFMQAALYEPSLGYYESAPVFGTSGDFVTGVEIGPWLALGLSDLIVWGWQQLGCPAQWCLLEQGGGTGQLLVAVLDRLQQTDIAMPTLVVAVEASANMRDRQHQRYMQAGIQVQQVAVLDELEPQSHCLMFCNELMDAFPVRCFCWNDHAMFERGVVCGDDGFAWEQAEQDLQNPPDIDAELQAAWPDAYISEWNPTLDPWQASIADMMQQGYVFSVDYGYAQSEYYRAGRIEGTLLVHEKHQTDVNILARAGMRDLTAHVDFTALHRAGIRAGMDTVCWMSQGAWLAQSPSVQSHIARLTSDTAAGTSAETHCALAQAKRMMMPSGMGESFKLHVQKRGQMPDAAPSWLSSFNRAKVLRSP